MSSTDSEKAAVTEVLAAYYNAFSALDVQAVLLFYNEPAVSMSAQGVFVAADHQALAAGLGQVMDGLRAKGYRRSEFEIQDLRLLGASAASVTGVAVRYGRRRRGTGTNTNHLRSSRQCRLENSRHRVALITGPLQNTHGNRPHGECDRLCNTTWHNPGVAGDRSGQNLLARVSGGSACPACPQAFRIGAVMRVLA